MAPRERLALPCIHYPLPRWLGLVARPLADGEGWQTGGDDIS